MRGPGIVRNCYTILSASMLAGVEDYTEGIYHGDRTLPYPGAQRRQHEYLLDQLGVREGFRLLDVGCGTGSLLLRARERGARGTGITVSPEQVRLIRMRGLDGRLLDYRGLRSRFGREFDGIVANGSIEHFCQPEEAVAGRQRKVYCRMFEIFSSVLRPGSPSGRVVTTTIHFRRDRIDPRKVLRSPFTQWADEQAFHFSILHRAFGGFYPAPGMLAECAAPNFHLLAEVDGTEDYLFTSEEWRRRLAAALRGCGSFRRHLAGGLARHPRSTVFLLLCFFGPQSWLWQFRGTPSPAILYRHTWSLG